MNEIWRDIKGFEGKYQVSNLGRVKSLNYNKTGEEKMMISRVDRYGYLKIMLSKEGIRTWFTVHRLVAQAFIPNPNNYPCVNHIDKNRTNNCVWNLEWCTYQYNIDYSKSKTVLQFDLDGNFIREWKSTREAERDGGFKSGSISDCCNGLYSQHKGYIWKYK